MGLSVSIDTEYAADSGSLDLPRFVLEPTEENNVPWIKKFQVDVTPDREDDRLAELAGVLSKAYRQTDYHDGEEYRLGQSVGVSPAAAPVSEPLEADESFVLEAKVWYYDSVADGSRANTDAGLKGPIVQKMTVQPRLERDAPVATAVPIEPGDCQILIEPRTILLSDRGAGQTLSVRVLNRPSDKTPELQLIDVPAEAEALLRSLEGLLDQSLERESPEVEVQELWTATFELRLDPDARRELAEVAQQEPLEVRCRVWIPDVTSSEFSLRLRHGEDLFPGLLALDFGTSNSTITLYDPGVVETTTGLAHEQEHRLKELLLTRLIDENGTCPLDNVDPDEWNKILERAGRNLRGEGTAVEKLRSAIRMGSLRMFEAVRQLEACLGATSLRPRVFKALSEIYHEAFQEPRLKSQSLVAVPLDPDYPQERDIPSEIEIKNPGPPLELIVGRRARQDHRAALARADSNGGTAEADDTGSNLSLDQIERLFHHSSKRHLGMRKSFTVNLGDNSATVTANQLVQRAWSHLLDLTDGWRNRHPMACSKGHFSRIVVTYPTVSPPSVRKEVEHLTQELLDEQTSFPDVVTDYDEAVAAALFYLHREFGGSLDLGPEIFKARSHREGNKWYQNVLVLDIGGGSTDLALLRLTMEEIDPFEPGEDRGAGGRCYVVSPRLLGSSGHTHLGGELITLRLFQLLKAMVADRVLVGVQDGRLDCATLSGKIAQLDQRFSDANGRYEAGSLVECILDLPETDPGFGDALETAEQIIPTRWRNDSRRLQAFYTLWEHAEAAKLRLGKRPTSELMTESHALDDQDISSLLHQSGIAHTLQDGSGMRVELTVDHFDRIAEPVIREAITIARGLLASRLPDKASANGRDEKELLDWLILSGKTCNLDLVHRVVRQEFINSPHFVWNPEQVTFVPEYAKLATSAGACYGEKMRRTSFDPRQFRDQLRLGRNQLTYNIDNLFFFLPCAFLVIGPDTCEIEIFRAGQPLYRLDDEEVGKTRSKPIGPQELISVMRRDFQSAKSILWGSFDGKALAKRLDISIKQFLETYHVQYEVDHRLFIRLYIWEGDSPEYQIDTEADFVDVLDGMKDHTPEGESTSEDDDNGMSSNPEEGSSGEEMPEEATPTAGWDIAVDVVQAQINNKEPQTLIEAGQPLTEVFHYSKDETKRGCIAELPNLFGHDHKLALYARKPGTSEWIQVGELTQPESQVKTGFSAERTPEYPRRYSLTLDGQGIARVHLGVVPYWKTEDFDEWKESLGCVYRCDLPLVEPMPRENRDAFSGVH